MQFPLDRYITEDDIDKTAIIIEQSAIEREAKRRIEKGYYSIKKNASQKAIREQFGDVMMRHARRKQYKKKAKYKEAFERLLKEEPNYKVIMDAMSGEGRYYEMICREAKLWLINRKAQDLVFKHNNKVEKHLRLEKIRMQKEMMLTKIPERYCDLYPLARAIDRQFILHVGPTNSGKTYSAMEDLKEAGNGVYLAPLRLLAYENYEKIRDSGINCNMITGEEEIYMEGAEITCSTIEMLNLDRHYDVAVIDEAQLISNTDRGGAWTQAILGVCADRVHVCMAEQALDIVIRLIEECGNKYEIVHHERKTLLRPQKTIFRFPGSVKKGDALIAFSRKDVLQYAVLLEREGIKCSVIYGNLPYDVRHKEAARFMSGETSVVVSTDAIGMGLNLPIRRVVFLETWKFDGIAYRPLRAEEIQQIAGRAGRYGIYNTGYFASISPSFINNTYYMMPKAIDHAMVNIPSNLIDVCDRYSDLLMRWKEIEPRVGYRQSDIDEKMFLAKALEDKTDDKHLVADFVNIPFDVNIGPVKDLWFRLFGSVLEGDDYVVNTLAELLDEHTMGDLKSLEVQYKKLDVAFAFCRKFGFKDGLEPIMKEKRLISERINKILVGKPVVSKVELRHA